MSQDSRKDDENKNSSTKPPYNDDDYGYYFFPNRSDHEDDSKYRTIEKFVHSRSARNAFKCFMNVHQCLKTDPVVRLLTSALKKKGCELDSRRHISCENCRSMVNGGFDPIHKQVVVCQNKSTSENLTCHVLGHELVHMYDYCRADVDFTNLQHLACTEIRAANFFHCSLTVAVTEGDASPINFSNKHRACVYKKALMSVLAVRNVDQKQARDAVDRVFERCYNDLEPIGRRPYTLRAQAHLSKEEAKIMGI